MNPRDPDAEVRQIYRHTSTEVPVEDGIDPAEREAMLHYQNALYVALSAALLHTGYVWLFISRRSSDWVVGLFFVVAAIGCGYWLLRLFGFWILMIASLLFHFVFGGAASRAAWQRATQLNMWTLPYGVGLGAILWLTYSIGRFGGWPGNVIFSALANLVGAWMYLTIFRAWYLLRKATPKSPANR